MNLFRRVFDTVYFICTKYIQFASGLLINILEMWKAYKIFVLKPEG